jgi:4a-hydroxytetrahydrobiopterin dehydratase
MPAIAEKRAKEMKLAEKECTACAVGAPRLTGAALKKMLDEVVDWRAVNEHHLEKEFKFPDFVTALTFTNKIGEVAEEQGHHPDIYLTWGKVKIQIWTHKIDGLTESDFILAAKIDQLPK